jgi:hypothetical protein
VGLEVSRPRQRRGAAALWEEFRSHNENVFMWIAEPFPSHASLQNVVEIWEGIRLTDRPGALP